MKPVQTCIFYKRDLCSL